MKKIFFALSVLLCFGVPAFTQSASKLAEYGIEKENNNYHYSHFENLESGKTYMCLTGDKQKNIRLDKDGRYGIFLYEVVTKDDSDAVLIGKKYIKTYPSAVVYRTTQKEFDIPEEIIFDKLENLFGKNWNVIDSGWWTGWATMDSRINKLVGHRMHSYSLDPIWPDEVLAEHGIKLKTENDGKSYYIYSETFAPEKGKKYIGLNLDKQKKYEKKDSYYQVYLYEVVDKNDPDAFKVDKKYVKSYPSAFVALKNCDDISFYEEFTFEDLNSLYGQTWVRGNSWSSLTGRVFDSEFEIYVNRSIIGCYLTRTLRPLKPIVPTKEVTPEILKEKGIVAVKLDNGGTYYRYSYAPPVLEKGKSYMCLNLELGTETIIEHDLYELALYEFVDANDKDSIKINGKYIRHYPVAVFYHNNPNIKLGKVIVFDKIENMFDGEWITAYYNGNNTEGPSIEPELGITVHHPCPRYDIFDKKVLDANGIEMVVNKNWSIKFYYKQKNDLEKGKSYMCLQYDMSEGLKKEGDNYVTSLYEIVKKNTPDAVNVNGTYIKPYASAIIAMNDVNGIEIPEKIKFNSLEDLNTLFGGNWDVRITENANVWNKRDEAVLGRMVFYKYGLYFLTAK